MKRIFILLRWSIFSMIPLLHLYRQVKIYSYLRHYKINENMIHGKYKKMFKHFRMVYCMYNIIIFYILSTSFVMQSAISNIGIYIPTTRCTYLQNQNATRKTVCIMCIQSSSSKYFQSIFFFTKKEFISKKIFFIFDSLH